MTWRNASEGKGMDVNVDSADSRQDSRRGKARAPLAVRAVLGALAALALALALVAGANMVGRSSLSAATDSLRTNIAQAGQEDVDLSVLAARQRQLDAQFADASAMDWLLLPSLREAIASNAAVSRTLSERIDEEISRQEGRDTDQTDKGRDGGDTDDSAQNGTKGLSEEQRQQVEDLLKANQSSGSANQPTGGDTSETGNQIPGSTTGDQNVKPW